MFIAILKMPLMNTVLLSNSAPLFIPLIAWLWLREKISASTAISLVVGFVGVLLILKPGASLPRNPAALLATAAGLFLLRPRPPRRPLFTAATSLWP